VGNEKAFMTTRLQEDRTRFFPFNLDTENPINLTGHKTAYLWEDIWQPDTLLLLISNYLHIQTNTERRYDPQAGKVVEVTSEAFIFPRYHQLDVVRKVLQAVHHEGPGRSYLIQHSAGSGQIQLHRLAGSPAGQPVPTPHRQRAPLRFHHRRHRPARARQPAATHDQAV
jgi:type I restriction enzyme R subunit